MKRLGDATDPKAVKKTDKKSDPLQGYTPPFKAKVTAASEMLKAKAADKPRKVYTLEFCFSFKATNKQRPDNMAELNFPHKKMTGMRKKAISEKDKFN